MDKATCSSECANHVKTLAANEGARMRIPLEAVVTCGDGLDVHFIANLHSVLVDYVADAWTKCDPASSDPAFDRDIEQADHRCQLGSSCLGTEVNCRKVSRFIDKIDTVCPKQCDVNGTNKLTACRPNQPERNSSTCMYFDVLVCLCALQIS
jgi:hypothetical protein